MKKIKIQCDIRIEQHKRLIYGVSGDDDLDIRINAFIGPYFTFYSGILSSRRALKRNTWIYELLYHRGDRLEKSKSYNQNGQLVEEDRFPKPIRMLEGVEKTGRYSYKEYDASPFLVRKLFDISDKPGAFLS